jgi:hypothetical protein
VSETDLKQYVKCIYFKVHLFQGNARGSVSGDVGNLVSPARSGLGGTGEGRHPFGD